MAKDLDIVNLALVKVGSEPIRSFDDDLKEARLAKSFYAMVRDSELASYRWAFAVARADIAPEPDKPTFGFEFSYALPSDFLRLERICDALYHYDMRYYQVKSDDVYVIEGNKILTSIGPTLKIVYTRRVSNASLFPPTFVTALADRLALTLCESLTQSNSKIEMLSQQYSADIRAAKRNNDIQFGPSSIPDSGAILERL